MQDVKNSKVAGLNRALFDQKRPAGIHGGGRQSAGPNVPRATPTSAAKEWIAFNLPYWCNDKALTLETEVVFCPGRKWRFDYVITAHKIAIEFEGIYSTVSRHTSHKGFNGDIEKYNAAVAQGYRLLRFTAANYKTLFTELNKLIECK